MIQQLCIDNYRGIDSLCIQDLGLVNIFVGQNGVGKTSVLEAVALLASPTVKMHERLGKWRDMSSVSPMFKTAFHNLDYSTPISITGQNYSEGWSLRIDALTEIEADKIITPHLISEDSSEEGTTQVDEELHGVKHTFESGGRITRSTLALHGNHYHRGMGNENAKSFGVFFIHARRASSVFESAHMVTKIAGNRTQEESLLKTLQSIKSDIARVIKSDIARVRVGTTDNRVELLVDFDDELPLPITALGDGFNRLLLMLTGIIGTNSKILVVDEIDSGIHHTVMSTVWRSLANVTHQYNKQVFCVTHNEEMLTATLDGFDDDQDALRIYRMARKNRKLIAQKYNYELFRDAEIAGFPVR